MRPPAAAAMPARHRQGQVERHGRAQIQHAPPGGARAPMWGAGPRHPRLMRLAFLAGEGQAG